jgi:death-on-curing protein
MRYLTLNEVLELYLVGEQERIILQVAAGELGRDEFTDWLGSHVV